MSTEKKSRDEIVEAALEGGLIGAALGAALTGMSRGAIVSALVGAAIGASLKAQREAKKLEIPVLYEEDGSIYKVFPDGRREFVKKLKGTSKNIPLKFSLE